MQRMVAEGHEIGNHTYSHKYLDKLGASEIQSQIQRGNEAIQAVAGVPAVIVRLPGGNKNATVLANVNAPMIMWSIDTLDWKLKNAQTTIDAVLGKVRDGDIVLMHELYSSTGDAAMQIIPALVERGYQLVTNWHNIEAAWKVESCILISISNPSLWRTIPFGSIDSY